MSACRTPHGGRPEAHPRRETVDALRYVVDTGCEWSALPSDYPPFKTVFGFFSRFPALLAARAAAVHFTHRPMQSDLALNPRRSYHRSRSKGGPDGPDRTHRRRRSRAPGTDSSPPHPRPAARRPATARTSGHTPSGPLTDSYSLRTEVEDLGVVLDAFDSTRALFGWSYGGCLASLERTAVRRTRCAQRGAALGCAGATGRSCRPDHRPVQPRNSSLWNVVRHRAAARRRSCRSPRTRRPGPSGPPSGAGRAWPPTQQPRRQLMGTHANPPLSIEWCAS